jgi:hypothetical protein
MSSASNSISSPCKNGMEGEVVGSKPGGCLCNLLMIRTKDTYGFVSNLYHYQEIDGSICFKTYGS